jgi:hypothetical protein
LYLCLSVQLQFCKTDNNHHDYNKWNSLYYFIISDPLIVDHTCIVCVSRKYVSFRYLSSHATDSEKCLVINILLARKEGSNNFAKTGFSASKFFRVIQQRIYNFGSKFFCIHTNRSNYEYYFLHLIFKLFFFFGVF